ncbi:hypothetical protein FOY91_18200 [Sphingomonas solaris]|uniref:Uncharacterized protein n=2 Tax=Alterirhizorhabdus solaris TaxID=2529389 RepID=A0A558QUM8_9SPHN|nr:hypothetical protein [Sphingomonas solaris]TVV70819.1 hypothetical protein FOY91_18200 [Sphingomonas solaris]
MQGFLWIAAATSAGIAGGAALADRRRMRRVDRDRVGWVPWGGILLTALFVSAISVALAIKG